jgi:hypothetical protein
MNALLKTALITTVFTVFAATQEKTAELSDKSKVVYNLTEDKQLNGAYVVSTPDDKMSLRGLYKDNQRSGNWYAFNPDGSIFLRYNYDLKKLIMLDTVAINRARFTVAGNAEAQKLGTVPVPICSIEQYISILGTELQRKVWAENKSAEGTLDVDLTATVDANGQARYSGTYMAGAIKVTKKLIVNEKLFNIEWLPATYKGENLAGTFTVNMQVNFSSDPTKRQRFVWNY